MTDSAERTPDQLMEDIVLQLDNGSSLEFKGRLFSEASWYDEDTGVLTHQKLFVTDTHEQVYSVVTGGGNNRSRRAYKISVQGETCSIFDGKTGMNMPFELLMLAVRSLCGLDEGAIPSLETVEETLRAANC